MTFAFLYFTVYGLLQGWGTVWRMTVYVYFYDRDDKSTQWPPVPIADLMVAEL